MKRKNCGPALITRVETGSPADLAGVREGDRLLKAGGAPLRDVLDLYLELAERGPVELLLERAGVEFTVSVEADGPATGLEVDEPVFGRVMTCDNNCVFCFVDQLPEGLRDTLYVKDDDYRLSFLSGNFITLTNLEKDDVRRIKTERLSPLYVSLHSTDVAVRKKLFGNPEAGRPLRTLKELLRAGIGIHAQIVLVKGINDREHLDRTLRDIAREYREILSVGVVPVGMSSGGRRTLDGRYSFDRETSRRVLDQVCGWRNRLAGITLCAADEFFFMAGMHPPDREYYGTFDQLENGVGLTRSFQDRFAEAASLKPHCRGCGATVLTSPAGAWALSPLKLERFGARVLVCRNGLFGERVDVCGLLPGSSVAECLYNSGASSPVLVPSVALDENQCFIDGVSLEEVSGRVGLQLRPVGCDGASLLDALTGSPEGRNPR